MILGGREIHKAIASDIWQVFRYDRKIVREDLHIGDEPHNEVYENELHIGPNSVDITLANFFKILMPTGNPIDPMRGVGPEYADYHVEDGDTIRVPPMGRLLASARERFVCDAPLDLGQYGFLAPMTFKPDIDGRSSIGRMFVAVHMTAGFGDYGFKAPYTLEIVNLGIDDFELRPGMRIAQVSFQAVVGPFTYNGSYVNQGYAGEPVVEGSCF